MSDETSDQPVVEEALAPADTGVADEANAQGDHANLDQDAGDGEFDEDGNPIEPAEPIDDDTEEVEHEGKKYKIAKALKPALLFNADYTRKTQEVAEQRRALDTERAAWIEQQTQQAEALTELKTDLGRVHTLEAKVAEFAKIDWRTAQTQIAALWQDPPAQLVAQAQYNTAWNDFTATERELQQAQTALSEKQTERSQEQQAQTAQALRETLSSLDKQIPGFTQEVAKKVVDHTMREFGLKAEEVRNLGDPRIWKLMHTASSLAEENASLKADLAKVKTQRTAVTANAAAQQVRPAAAVAGNVRVATAPRDDMDIKAWVKAEEARMARKAAR